MYIMASDPTQGISASEIETYFADKQSAQDLADAYAITHNAFWWFEDNEYDFQEGSPEHKAACLITDEWDSLMKQYDPIIITSKYTTEYHVHYFEGLAKRLSGHTQKCVISFVDLYRHLSKQFTPLGESEIYELAGRFSEIARKYNLTLETCAEAIDLSRFGINHGHCIDGELLERIIGQPLSLSKDKNQREECGCMASIDIGMYDSCLNGCKYCYANHSAAAVRKNFRLHDPSSPLLYGTIGPDDIVKDRAMESCKVRQLNMF